MGTVVSLHKPCPECGCKEIGRGRQMAQGSMYPLNKVFANGSQIVSEICTNCGYILSSDKEQIYDDIETNGWQCDYYMYIWKNGEYTGYALHGSYYYGDHKIEKDEIYRE